MTETEKYLFDVHSYLVIRNALTSDQLEAANAAVDAYSYEIKSRPNDLTRTSDTLQGTVGCGDLAGLLTWDKPHCCIFRELIALPSFAAYLEKLLVPGFRLEAMSAISMNEGAEGFWFHEGAEPHDR